MSPPTPESNTPIGRPSIGRDDTDAGRPASHSWATLPAVTGLRRRMLVALLVTAGASIAVAGRRVLPAGRPHRLDRRDRDRCHAHASRPKHAGGRLAGGDRHARARPDPRHGLAAAAMGPGERYAVLAFDARGTGDSGGLIGIDGPRKSPTSGRSSHGCATGPTSRTRGSVAGASRTAAAPRGTRSRLGCRGAALEISISWIDLLQALAPQGLAKTGVIAGFIGGLDPKRVDPEVLAVRDAARTAATDGGRPFAAARSSVPR